MALRQTTSYGYPRGHTLATGPTAEPVSATSLRTYVRADSTTLADGEANALIARARNYLEEMTGIAFITQTWTLTLDRWPGYVEPWWDGVRQMAVSELGQGRALPVLFPRYPLQSVSAVKVYDEASNETAVTVATVFDIDTQQKPGRMRPKSGQLWPIATRALNAVEITYIAGFGDDAADVPPAAADAILLLAGYFYEHRAECSMAEAFMKSGARELIGAYVSRGL